MFTNKNTVQFLKHDIWLGFIEGKKPTDLTKEFVFRATRTHPDENNVQTKARFFSVVATIWFVCIFFACMSQS